MFMLMFIFANIENCFFIFMKFKNSYFQGTTFFFLKECSNVFEIKNEIFGPNKTSFFSVDLRKIENLGTTFFKEYLFFVNKNR